ncbi:putative sulfate permease [Lachnellula suecica]|uniref:Putative sulfate permease n=1 Tax=Lachnellula suecica TaxID=602035 RepID=A0A8T9C0B9_9HELO|nr:putative sulfate permease [Lachnellula suecica]
MGVGQKFRNLGKDANISRVIYGAGRLAKGFPAGSGKYLLAKIPIATWLPNYSPVWVIDDVIAGLSVGSLLVPQSIAFAVISGISVQDALLSSWLPGLIYAFIGTSKDLTTGPSLSIALSTAQITAGVHTAAPQLPLAFVTAAVAIGVGIWSLILGLFNFGFIFDLLSDPAVDGLMMGIANVVIIGQVPALLGLTGVSNDFLSQMPEIIGKIGQSKPATFGIGAVAIVLLVAFQFLGKKWGHVSPIIRFIATTRHLNILGLFAGISFFVNNNLDVHLWAVTGSIPQGIKPVAAPIIPLFTSLFLPSITLMFTVAVEHISMGRWMGKVAGYKINNSQELTYLGITNIFTGLLGGAPVGGGDLARAGVSSQAGSRSPLAGLTSSGVVLLTMIALPDVLKWTPTATVSAVVIVSVIEAMPPNSLAISFADFFGMLMCFNFSMLNGSMLGTIAGIFIMLLYTIFRTMFTRSKPLTAADLESQHSSGLLSMWSAGESIPNGTQVINIPRDLMYLNASRIKTQIVDEILTQHYGIPPSAAELAKRQWTYRQEKHIAALRGKLGMSRTEASRLRVLVLDMTAVSFIDASGIQALIDIKTEVRSYAGHAVEFRFVGLCANVLRRFQRCRWELENPYEQRYEIVGDEEIAKLVEEEKIKDLVFSHLPLAIQHHANRKSMASRIHFAIDQKRG